MDQFHLKILAAGGLGHFYLRAPADQRVAEWVVMKRDATPLNMRMAVEWATMEVASGHAVEFAVERAA